ncbi:MAG: hypothetical protein A3E01_14425 [Gammaproteobacteria bacterium RIFCSPHIGHO2_12_FULL_63_22]|nr:MAG: hypothetical protein A3E01_14425 [Gammaproteobacteria bacterium RIFCSPHIGHO2_12_FULL_63_22]
MVTTTFGGRERFGRQIAAPIVGGMASSMTIILIMIPAIHSLVKRREFSRNNTTVPALGPSLAKT